MRQLPSLGAAIVLRAESRDLERFLLADVVQAGHCGIDARNRRGARSAAAGRCRRPCRRTGSRSRSSSGTGPTAGRRSSRARRAALRCRRGRGARDGSRGAARGGNGPVALKTVVPILIRSGGAGASGGRAGPPQWSTVVEPSNHSPQFVQKRGRAVTASPPRRFGPTATERSGCRSWRCLAGAPDRGEDAAGGVAGTGCGGGGHRLCGHAVILSVV
jgi:hypothetical protein